MGSLKAALKAFFPNNNGDTNFSSSCLVPYFDSSQNPKGCVTTSKLASVLGVLTIKTRDNNIDLNDWPTNTIGLCGTSNANKPTGESNNLGVVLCLKPANSTGGYWQILARWASSNYLYFRSKGESNTWGSWVKINVSTSW